MRAHCISLRTPRPFILVRPSIFARLFLTACVLAASTAAHAQDAASVRVAIVGLVHGHVKGFLSTLPKATNAKLVAIVEPDIALTKQYQEKFVEKEMLPLVEKQYNVKLTKDPDGRATMGGSSGGSCALIMAWYHPELYHRVLTYSGTYVNQQ